VPASLTPTTPGVVPPAQRSAVAAARTPAPPTSFGARPRPPASARPATSAPDASAPPPPRPAADPAAAQLLAVEMAVSGATRMEVDRRLRDEHGLRETRVLLDEVFGEGSAPGARLPWDGTGPGARPA
jgi:hypothetical protein